MRFWGRKRTASGPKGLWAGFVDIHAHLLPGVDDGVPDWQRCLALLDACEAKGWKSVCLTPHVMEDMPNATARLQRLFDELQVRYQGRLSLHLAAEYMLDLLFEERLEKKDFLPLAKNRVLVETSCYQSSLFFDRLLEKTLSAGYFPVLAHPERYAYLTEAEYARLKEKRVGFQLNLPSLVGFYGREIQNRSKWLLRQGMYTYAGTDTHSFAAWERLVEAKDLERHAECLLPLIENNKQLFENE